MPKHTCLMSPKIFYLHRQRWCSGLDASVSLWFKVKSLGKFFPLQFVKSFDDELILIQVECWRLRPSLACFLNNLRRKAPRQRPVSLRLSESDMHFSRLTSYIFYNLLTAFSKETENPYGEIGAPGISAADGSASAVVSRSKADGSLHHHSNRLSYPNLVSFCFWWCWNKVSRVITNLDVTGRNCKKYILWLLPRTCCSILLMCGIFSAGRLKIISSEANVERLLIFRIVIIEQHIAFLCPSRSLPQLWIELCRSKL